VKYAPLVTGVNFTGQGRQPVTSNEQSYVRGKMNHRLRVKMCLCILFLALAGSSFGTEEGLWGRNPFLTREEIASLQKKETSLLSTISKKLPLTQWEVKSIVISGSDKVAVINDYILTVGDYIGDEKVLEINQASVVLGGKKGKTVIKLKQPSISIRTDRKIR